MVFQRICMTYSINLYDLSVKLDFIPNVFILACLLQRVSRNSHSWLILIYKNATESKQIRVVGIALYSQIYSAASGFFLYFAITLWSGALGQLRHADHTAAFCLLSRSKNKPVLNLWFKFMLRSLSALSGSDLSLLVLTFVCIDKAKESYVSRAPSSI